MSSQLCLNDTDTVDLASLVYKHESVRMILLQDEKGQPKVMCRKAINQSCCSALKCHRPNLCTSSDQIYDNKEIQPALLN